jgi:hypothetical protein
MVSSDAAGDGAARDGADGNFRDGAAAVDAGEGGDAIGGDGRTGDGGTGDGGTAEDGDMNEDVDPDGAADASHRDDGAASDDASSDGDASSGEAATSHGQCDFRAADALDVAGGGADVLDPRATCAGICVGGAMARYGFCSERCDLRRPDGCSAPPSGTRRAVCALTYEGAGTGDSGYCAPTCKSAADCPPRAEGTVSCDLRKEVVDAFGEGICAS